MDSKHYKQEYFQYDSESDYSGSENERRPDEVDIDSPIESVMEIYEEMIRYIDVSDIPLAEFLDPADLYDYLSSREVMDL